MAAKDFPAGAPGNTKSYRNIVTGGPPPPPKVTVSYGEMQGVPAVFIADEDMVALAKPFELTLVGKFSVDRPSIADIRKFVVKMRFFGFVKVDNHDLRNVVFRFNDQRDYMRFFARRLYTVFGCEMRVTKWSPFSDIEDELPIVPLWVAFPGLRYQLYHLETLMDIAAIFGKPLCVDANTAAQGAMGKARVLVEVDISRSHPKWVWLGSRENGALQPVTIENLPLFCSRCKKSGHDFNSCKLDGKTRVGGGEPTSAPLLQWVPKAPEARPGSEGTHAVSKTAECNHPALPPNANFSNYKDYALNFLEGQSSHQESNPNSSCQIPAETNPIVVDGYADATTEGEVLPQISSPPPPTKTQGVAARGITVQEYSVQNILPGECSTAQNESGVIGNSGNHSNSLSSPHSPILVGTVVGAGLKESPADGASPVGSPVVQNGSESLSELVNSVLGAQIPVSVDSAGGQAPETSSLSTSHPTEGMEAVRNFSGSQGLSTTRQSSKVGNIVDVPTSLGGRFSLLAHMEGGSEEEACLLSSSPGKGGKKILFSNALNVGKSGVSPPSCRVTRSRAKGGDKGDKIQTDEGLDGWSLSKKGKLNGCNGPKALVLDALLNPQNSHV